MIFGFEAGIGFFVALVICIAIVRYIKAVLMALGVLALIAGAVVVYAIYGDVALVVLFGPMAGALALCLAGLNAERARARAERAKYFRNAAEDMAEDPDNALWQIKETLAAAEARDTRLFGRRNTAIWTDGVRQLRTLLAEAETAVRSERVADSAGNIAQKEATFLPTWWHWMSAQAGLSALDILKAVGALYLMEMVVIPCALVLIYPKWSLDLFVDFLSYTPWWQAIKPWWPAIQQAIQPWWQTSNPWVPVIFGIGLVVTPVALWIWECRESRASAARIAVAKLEPQIEADE